MTSLIRTLPLKRIVSGTQTPLRRQVMSLDARVALLEASLFGVETSLKTLVEFLGPESSCVWISTLSPNTPHQTLRYLEAMASNLQAMASNLIAMASNLEATSY